MKKTLFSLVVFHLLFLTLQEANAQMVYMPDSMLRQKLTFLGLGSCIIGDSIDSSCPNVVNALALDLNGSSIHNLQGIEVFTSLTYLDCSVNSIDSLPPLPSSLDTLKCYSNSLIAIASFPPTLTYLECEINQLSTLPALPSSLENIHCNGNLLTSLPTLPASLEYLECSGNLLTQLPALPGSILALRCNRNQITSLPALTANLNILECAINSLTALPALPNSLSFLVCDSNQILSLPSLPNSLFQLACGNNQLTSMPILPTTLQYLYCNTNHLTTLPILPTGLRVLGCGNNPIGSLPPALPPTLNGLYCWSNQLTVLPPLPPTLDYLNCDSNNLTSIPPLPDTLQYAYFENNPNLTCLPRLTKINYLYFRQCPVTCIPNYPNVLASYPPLSSLPLCDMFNPDNCNFYWNISGKTFFDADTDCVQSVNDTSLLNLKTMLYQNGVLMQQAFTGGEGFYSFDVNSFGNYEVRLDTASIPFTVECPASINYLDTISASDSLIYNNDFSVKCKSGFDIGVWSIVSTNFRPAHRNVIRINAGDLANFYGVHCANGISGTLTITLTGSIHYFGPVAGSFPISNVSGNVITYNIADFGLVHYNSDFKFELETDINAVIGSAVCIDARITTAAGDYNLSNDSLLNCFIVVSSYDPNVKLVYPEGFIDTTQSWLTYTIHFQNTGSAPAEHIYLLDTLDTNLDISSLQLLSTSHHAYVQILDDVVRFNFPNINLPDSISNEPLSHGYVQYKVKLKTNLSAGTTIHNTAHIYFDFNAPVATNTTTDIINIINSTSNITNVSAINIWPVPFSREFTIHIDNFSKGTHYSVTDFLGNEMANGIMNQSLSKISSASWPSGIYFLRVKSDSGVLVRKLLKN